MQNERFKPPSLPAEGDRAYRLYFLDGLGHITQSHEFFAAGDEAAMKIAEGWQEGRRMELWERARFVTSWPGPGS